MQMNESQFKYWMNAKTRQYIWLILHTDPNRVKIHFSKSFTGSFRYSHGFSNKRYRYIYYRTDYVINGWDCDLEALKNLIIHEVCHLKYQEHDNNFFTLYKKWSGDDFIERYGSRSYDYRNVNTVYYSHVVGLPWVK